MLSDSQRYLEHMLASISLDEERQGRCPLPESLLDDEPMFELVTRTRVERVGPRTIFRSG